MLSNKERNKILFDWNDTKHEFPSNKCVHELFERHAYHTPEAIALIHENQHLTYSELNNSSNQLANYLIKQGVKQKKLVGICFERSIEMFISIMAILKAGGTYVPLDPSYPTERLSFIINDTKMSNVITSSKFLPVLPKNSSNYICLNEINTKLIEFSGKNPERKVRMKGLVYVIYTSGTTGNPKGVKISHTNVQNYSYWFCQAFGVTNSDCFDFSSPLTFDLSVTSTLLPLMYGAKILICSEEIKAEPVRYVENLSTYSATIIKVTPSYFKEMLLILKGREQLKSLRSIILGGEAIVPKDTKNWLNIYPRHILVNEYGPTEATVATIAYIISKNHKYDNENFIPIGKPAFNTYIYILDDDLKPCSVGVTGELHIGGASVSEGYLNRTELTKQKFIPNPFNNTSGQFIYKTGDLARYLEDGNIEYLGRIDHQIKIRGFRIEAGEIESNLLLHPGIISAAVIASDSNNGQKKLIAYLVYKQGYTPSIFELRTFLNNRLPSYMIPHIFVILDKLPMTKNGKLDRDALPDAGEPISEAKYVPAASDTEKKLIIIWQKILKVKKIGTHDNFFVMGGDSLLAAQLVTQIEELFSIEIALVSFYEKPTIFEISPIINKKMEQRKNQEDIELTKLLDQIENMNDEDIRSQLSENE